MRNLGGVVVRPCQRNVVVGRCSGGHVAWVRERGVGRLLYRDDIGQDGVVPGRYAHIVGGVCDKILKQKPRLTETLNNRSLLLKELGRPEDALAAIDKAIKLKKLVQKRLWNKEAEFFEVLHPNGKLADVREEIGFIPWYF